MIGIAYFPVAAGSPGPFDKNIPSGFKFNISFALVLHGTTFTLHLKSEKYLRIFFFKLAYQFLDNLFAISKKVMTSIIFYTEGR